MSHFRSPALSDLQHLPVFGIAGNFADHLQQAGEDADFTHIQTAEATAPKGIFPIYIPQHPGQLGIFPLCHDRIEIQFHSQLHLQAEPELCLLFNVDYDSQHHITQLTPQAFNVFNDCSIRRPDAKKISEKKNWGPCSKGIGERWFPCEHFEPGGTLADYHLISFLERDRQCYAYGEDSPVETYSYFYHPLIQWLIETFNQQSDEGPLEDLRVLLATAGHPNQILVTLGATRYTPFGEQNYLRPNDQLTIWLYHQTERADFSTSSCLAENPLTKSLCLSQKMIDTKI